MRKPSTNATSASARKCSQVYGCRGRTSSSSSSSSCAAAVVDAMAGSDSANGLAPKPVPPPSAPVRGAGTVPPAATGVGDHATGPASGGAVGLGVGDQLCVGAGAGASVGLLVAGAVARAWAALGCHVDVGDGASAPPAVGHAAGAAAAGGEAIQLGPSRRAAAGPPASDEVLDGPEG